MNSSLKFFIYMKEAPLISVIIPCYNEEAYIKDLLESIKQQTYTNYEVIAVDSSDDSTPKILKKYGVKLIKVPKTNIAAARNVGIKAAKGDILALIDADYVLQKNLFLNIVKFFQKAKYSKVVCIEPRPRVNLKDLRKRDRFKFKILNEVISFYKKVSFFTFIPAAYGCDFCRADAVKKSGLFNEKIDVAEDEEFFSRLRRYGKFKQIKNTVKMSYRRHSKEGTLKTGAVYFLGSVAALFVKKFKFKFKSIRRKSK
ncbi:MAG: glycosyl transferase family 2 [Candidatus Parvarchaeum acidophilus ARMAN-5]|uniref:Glycosyl transferase family 2 n=1 Tax=Candidatus Parvarchaeum acidophilus ARMAN-5 TaxID=662762 RepID=D6GUE8_PARA5|nr:MAG: glycosyl transferase family 2 [Candidatus Parvarchaeum acidophilus ARMAN-5]